MSRAKIAYLRQTPSFEGGREIFTPEDLCFNCAVLSAVQRQDAEIRVVPESETADGKCADCNREIEDEIEIVFE